MSLIREAEIADGIVSSRKVAVAPIMGVITTTSNAIGSWDYDAPFSNGLTMVTVGNSLDATIVFE